MHCTHLVTDANAELQMQMLTVNEPLPQIGKLRTQTVISGI